MVLISKVQLSARDGTSGAGERRPLPDPPSPPAVMED